MFSSQYPDSIQVLQLVLNIELSSHFSSAFKNQTALASVVTTQRKLKVIAPIE